ncbi:MAG: GNAT family N-acetyltransferase [Luteolibacter sp.]
MTKQLIPAPWKFDPPGNLRIIDVRSARDLAPHAAAWAELLLQSPAASPMLSYPQVSAFFETQIPASETWLCLFAYEGERLAGVFPLIAVRSFGVLGFSILCFKTPYDNLHTSGVDCLTLHGREEIVDVFVDYVSRIPRTWPLIRLRELPEHSPSMVYVNQAGSRLSAVRNLSAAENHIRVSADYEKYHAGLSSNFRRQLKRGSKKLQELEGVVFHCREETRALAGNMRRFEEVEDAGWKGAENTSIKAVDGNSRFYTIAAERFRDDGWMEWNFLETGEKTIGAHYAVRIKRTLFLLKIGYDEAYSACSPGNLLLAKVIEHASRAGDVDEINCVAECAWHKNWGMQQRLLYDLVILPKIPVVSRLLSRIFQSELFKQVRARWKNKKGLAGE